MAIDPVKIPQDVSIPDKVVGPITLRQLIMVLIGGGISYTIWSAMKKTAGEGASIGIGLTIAAWLPMMITAAFAFVKINNVSLFRLLLLQVERGEKPGLRVWGPRTGLTINIHAFGGGKEEKYTKEMPNASAKELSRVLDTGLDELEQYIGQQQVEPKETEETMDHLLSTGQIETMPVRKERISVTPPTASEASINDITPLSMDNGDEDASHRIYDIQHPA